MKNDKIKFDLLLDAYGLFGKEGSLSCRTYYDPYGNLVFTIVVDHWRTGDLVALYDKQGVLKLFEPVSQSYS